ncbi:hypothetical protein SAMN04487914_108122 [Arthrobacter sp. ok909]|uniref:hypothetical protein n=1 Tax=Arthrobacter sp. ok909 TaxID=1761746 RepID=UPI00088353E7|nr:hypothetical protein [Arthrobacter sp. ok909]SDP33849.1 hypothetical protein SAMN04487914_108122 [Arthrobacter sp. ok909]
MSIIRSRKNAKYTTVSNVAANDSKLSLKAIGLFYFLMTKPDTWQITERGVVAQRPEGRDAVSAALKELEEAGYLRREKSRNENGKFVPGGSDLFEEPWLENPTMENPPQVITNIVNTKEDGSTNHGLAPVTEKPDNRDPQVNEVVEKFEAAFELRLPRMPYQRRAAKTLISRHKLKGTLKLITAAAACRGRKFAPMILSLEDLRDKTNNLIEFYKRETESNNIPRI